MKRLFFIALSLLFCINARAMEGSGEKIRVSALQGTIMCMPENAEFDQTFVASNIQALRSEALLVRTYLCGGIFTRTENLTSAYHPEFIKYVCSCVLDGDSETVAQLSVKYHGVQLPQWEQRIVITDGENGAPLSFKIEDPAQVQSVCLESNEQDNVVVEDKPVLSMREMLAEWENDDELALFIRGLIRKK